MAGVRREREDDDLQRALEEGAAAAAHDPDEADIAADDAGGTLLAQELEAELSGEAEEEAQAHPS